MEPCPARLIAAVPSPCTRAHSACRATSIREGRMHAFPQQALLQGLHSCMSCWFLLGVAVLRDGRAWVDGRPREGAHLAVLGVVLVGKKSACQYTAWLVRNSNPPRRTFSTLPVTASTRRAVKSATPAPASHSLPNPACRQIHPPSNSNSPSAAPHSTPSSHTLNASESIR